MSTPEDRLRQMMFSMEQDEDAARIDEPIMMAQAQPPEGFTPGLSEEEALGLRADIAAAEAPFRKEEIQGYLQETGSPAAEPGAFLPERRENPYAPVAGVTARINPYAPRAPEERTVDFPTEFPMERGTSRAALQLPELGSQLGTQAFFPEDLPMWAQLGLTSAISMTTDPTEIGEIFTQKIEYEDPNTGEMVETQMFPHLGLQQAPDGTLILTNSKTDAKAVINRPGLSAFDLMQLGTLGIAYTPTGRLSTAASAPARAAAQAAATNTARRLALRTARRKGALAMMGGSAVTETGIQAGQALAGGEFNYGDIAASTLFGAAPDYIFDPLARTATKIPSMLPGTKVKLADVVPENIRQALQYAKDTGRRIMSEDVIADRMTPAMRIFTKVVDRIPITGTGRQRKEMARQRIDALTEIAAKYGIDVETDYGTRVMESFVDRMMKRRFWGTNEQLVLKGNRTRANEMIERAFEKEMDEISHGVLQNAIRQDRIDDIVVDRVMDAGRPPQLKELFNKLMPEGKEAARNRFILRGLEEASWTPGSPGIADPKKFMEWLDRPANRKLIKEWFEPEDRAVLEGAREYLRLTASAQEAGKGSGMVAAAATGAGGVAWMAGVFNALIGSTAGMSVAGRAYQNTFRDFFLKLAHTKGDEAATAAIMSQLRPLAVAAENQWKQDRYYFPPVNITAESLKEGGENLLLNTEDAAKDAMGDIGQLPDKIMKFLKGGE